MKKISLTLVTLIALSAVFAGCEKADYQHPLHRSSGK